MGARDTCYKISWKLESIMAPGLRHSQMCYEDELRERPEAGRTWLDLGCGWHLLSPWRLEQEREIVGRAGLLVGTDSSREALLRHRTMPNRIESDIARLPFADGSFDLVTANMVFEHLADPEAQLVEIRRVLKPGGTLVFHTPNRLGYGTLLGRAVPGAVKDRLLRFLWQRQSPDVFPAFYRVNSDRAIRRAAAGANLLVREIRLVPSVPQFTVFPPLVVVELLWIRALMAKPLAFLRPVIIAVLEKPAPPA